MTMVWELIQILSQISPDKPHFAAVKWCSRQFPAICEQMLDKGKIKSQTNNPYGLVW
jgi:hypothetical protein